MKVGIIGAGGIAEQHLAALRGGAAGEVTIAGVAGRSLARAEAVAKQAGAPAFADWRQLLDTRPDAVFVCVTPDAHGAIELALVERRIPFFVEKPLAIDWDTAANVARAVEAAGLVTAVGYHLRYASTVERAKEILAGRRVGLAVGHWLTRTPAPAWWSARATSGGQTIEQMTHVFDVARWLAGEIDSVYGVSARVPRASGLRGDVDEVAATTVTFASGAVGLFSSTHLLAASYRVGIHLFAEGLALEVSPALLVVDDGKTRTEHRAEGNPTEREDRAFLDAVRTGDARGIRSSYADALRTHRVTTSVVRSAAEGTAVRLDGGDVR